MHITIATYSTVIVGLFDLWIALLVYVFWFIILVINYKYCTIIINIVFIDLEIEQTVYNDCSL